MPGAFLVAGGITRLAPLNWIGPAISLVVLQLLASLALLRALHVILGWRPVLLLPLTFALVHTAGRAGVCVVGGGAELAADARRDGVGVRRRDAAGAHRQPAVCGHGAAVYVGGLLFFEKAAVIPFVAFTIAALSPMSPARVADGGVAPRGSAVGACAGGDGGVDRACIWSSSTRSGGAATWR